MSDIKTGDWVRLSIEANVTHISGGHLVYLSGGGVPFDLESEYVSIEKLEPPVEVFKPGDVVRSKAHPDIGFLLLTENAHYLVPGDGQPCCPDQEFTSERYEKVELVEKPF